MINREELLALEFYKKRPFKGSDKGIRYMITKEKRVISEDQEETLLAAYIWPEPFCFEVTKDELKIKEEFPFSEEGLCQAMNWINEKHDEVILMGSS